MRDSAFDRNEKAFADLLTACRIGDIEAVDSLVSTPGLDINQLDEWDYSPLILASLCGHKGIVELLLSRGAICDRDTFQGARCVYGALTDEIRELLLSFDITKQVDSSQPFASHISSFINSNNKADSCDLIIYSPEDSDGSNRGMTFRVNRFLLTARSPFFMKQLAYGGEWYDTSVVRLQSPIKPEILKALIDYVYLKTEYFKFSDDASWKVLIDVAQKYCLNDYADAVERIHRASSMQEERRTFRDATIEFVERARRDLDQYLQDHVFGNKFTVTLDLEELTNFEDIVPQKYISKQEVELLMTCTALPDVILTVIDVESESVIYFPSHKAILSRSEYFNTMFKSFLFEDSQIKLPLFKPKDFDEKAIIDRLALSTDHIPVVQLSPNASSLEIARIVLSYLYHDDVPPIPIDKAVDLLFTADELLLDRLKHTCALSISSKYRDLTYANLKLLQKHAGYNAYDLIRVAWQSRCDKLEQYITKFIAYVLKDIMNDPNERILLSDLVYESAHKIQERQDTDTIELIDDIRYYLSEKHAVRDACSDFEPMSLLNGEDLDGEDIGIYKESMHRYERDLDMIDMLLNDLSLEA